MINDLLESPNLDLTAVARDDLVDGEVSQHLVEILRRLIADNQIVVRLIKTGHPMGPVSPAGRRNDHYFYCALDINAVDDIEIDADPTTPAFVHVGEI